MDESKNTSPELLFGEEVEKRVLYINEKATILDVDVAYLYGVKTKEINQAVKNNPDKFPKGYIIELTKKEKEQPVKNFDRFKSLKHSSVNPKAFTEKGLYMLATILKSPKATQTTIEIIETFAKIKELKQNIHQLQSRPSQNIIQKNRTTFFRTS